MILLIKGKIYNPEGAQVMGIVNCTPDSFYTESRATGYQASDKAAAMLVEGADMLDIGACSTRPGASTPTSHEEICRLEPVLDGIRSRFPEAILSVDTFRAEVANWCITHYGVDIINDVSGGTLDPEIQDVVAEKRVPYVLTHMRGTPQTMQSLTDYNDVTADVLQELARKVDSLRLKGVADIIIDPGFGFAKTTSQNFELLKNINVFKVFGLPLLVGVSRKSMIYHTLGATPEESSNGTTVLNTIALLGGADILRVHDVRLARESIKLVTATKKS